MTQRPKSEQMVPTMDQRQDVTTLIAYQPRDKILNTVVVSVSLLKVPKVTLVMMKKYEKPVS